MLLRRGLLAAARTNIHSRLWSPSFSTIPGSGVRGAAQQTPLSAASSTSDSEIDAASAASPLERLRDLLRCADDHVVGHADLKEAMLLGIVAREHVYIEGPPGSAKTYLSEVFAESTDLEFFFYQMHRKDDCIRTDARAHASRLLTTSTALATHAHTRTHTLTHAHTRTPPVSLSPYTPHGNGVHSVLSLHMHALHMHPPAPHALQRRPFERNPPLATASFESISLLGNGVHVTSAPPTFSQPLPSEPSSPIYHSLYLLLPNTLYPHDLLTPFPFHTLSTIYTPLM